MKFRSKVDTVLALQPDILVVQECKNFERLKFGPDTKKPNDYFWYGGNPNKGIGIFTYGNYKLKLREWHNPEFKMILPISASDGLDDFTLFAIWANNPDDPINQYVGQVWKAINFYEQYLSCSKTLLIGDFNSNVIWDKARRIGNHSTVVKYLAEKEIHSLYHYYHKEEQGKETRPTLYMYRHEDKPYHIDYCFASTDFIEKLRSLDVGEFKEWRQYSDHMPVIIDLF